MAESEWRVEWNELVERVKARAADLPPFVSQWPDGEAILAADAALKAAEAELDDLRLSWQSLSEHVEAHEASLKAAVKQAEAERDELREELDHVSADLIDAVTERDQLRRQLAAIEAAAVEHKRLLAGFDE